MSASELLTLSDGTYLTDATRYRRVLGRLQYMSFTRPDIAYAVNKLSQFMQAPSDHHWKAVKRVVQYLRGTIQLGLRVTPIDEIVDRVSTSGYILFLGHNPISWVRVVHVHGADQIADTLTKALSKSAFESNLFMLGLVTHRLT
uniref:Reverse transcriptase Ty1/copia-type domain-containing protein n=1 Tax=Solanum lycopersicum TaxID=4081 RepID=A0A3Q7ECE1_SOLLC